MDFLPCDEVYDRGCEKKDVEAPVPPSVKEIVGSEKKDVLLPKAQPRVNQQYDADEEKED